MDERRTRSDSGTVPACLRCRASHVIRWGYYGPRLDRRRYRCAACGLTFSDTTGTPLAYLKKADRWQAFGRCVLKSMTVRRTAAAIGVHRDTAFRWRHRLLDAVRAASPGRDDFVPEPLRPALNPPPLAGRIEVGEGWFLFSEKGKRPLDRPPRLTAWTTDWLRMPRAWVVAARDDGGRFACELAGLRRPSAADLEAVLRPVVARPGAGASEVVIASRNGPISPVATAARRLGIPYDAKGHATPGPADRHLRDLRRWLRPFKGVATRYLPNYLAWHRGLVLVGES